MKSPKTWRVAHLGANDTTSYDQIVADFRQPYAANNEPEGMAMFSHNDSVGVLMGVSITPESVPYCPFSAGWSEQSKPPYDFGNTGWVAGDIRLK